ncbi:hypothetical protein E2P84_07375 [Burkholderia cepacia]|uniref:Uncharacterized protein n=2 Tax=Burkholderia TaxID=32008 RepID=A0AAQ0FEK0_BURCE|nr:hypothetical protein CEQ23_40390 [Burkholderia cepacia]QCY07516.1 hypothetical protein EJ998_31740 [Burkholderia cepacia ATCC 25416]RBB32892.1 hypothetical protein DPV79_36800 [Burkholderia reimsis]KAB1590474.1 hypothetical protein C5O75_018130 [Burkholderia cepacia]MBA9898688.1 hypothetical protein [Burkholderia cepacia]
MFSRAGRIVTIWCRLQTGDAKYGFVFFANGCVIAENEMPKPAGVPNSNPPAHRGTRRDEILSIERFREGGRQ